MDIKNATNQELISWGESRETDANIVRAIFALSEDLQQAQEIWEEPTDEQMVEIAQIATNNGQIDPRDLMWEIPLSEIMGYYAVDSSNVSSEVFQNFSQAQDLAREYNSDVYSCGYCVWANPDGTE